MQIITALAVFCFFMFIIEALKQTEVKETIRDNDTWSAFLTMSLVLAIAAILFHLAQSETPIGT